jgi:hypothetical protein
MALRIYQEIKGIFQKKKQNKIVFLSGFKKKLWTE